MARLPLFPLAAQFVGSAVVLGLFVARGFTLREHSRIMLGALVVCWLASALWILATAAENASGWRRLGAGNSLLVLAATLLAAFTPAVLLWLIVGGS
jgi:hypothetical protein